MSDNNAEKTIQWLVQKWGDRPCPMCGEMSWQVDTRIYQLMEFAKGNFVVGGPVIPLIPVTCKNCGNTVLLNALVCGAVKNDDKEGEK